MTIAAIYPGSKPTAICLAIHETIFAAHETQLQRSAARQPPGNNSRAVDPADMSGISSRDVETATMTPAKVQLVQDSFRKVVPIADAAADLFYDRLFIVAPHVRSLFPQELSEQKKKLMQMLATAIANLHHLHNILPAVEALGRRHAGYGVTDEHYAIVGEALLWTLEQGLGDDFTPPVKEAWTETYHTVSVVMKNAAAVAIALEAAE